MGFDFDRQLAELRSRVAVINRKYEGCPPPAASQPAPRHRHSWFIEEWASGQVVENPWGSHFQMERLYESHRRHGSADIGALEGLPDDFLDSLGQGQIPPSPPEKWAFLDTETTGLAGGTGTYAFLIGVGRITREGFRIRQFFMREYAEEKSVLFALAEYLAQFDVLITYNGKSYDQPLLETRYRMVRQAHPFSRLPHLDLLHGARRIWKLRFENCRLSYLEREVLGVEREGDLPGELIPYVYFEYLRSGQARRLIPIFHHNTIDILTLGCLTGIVPAAFDSAWHERLAELGLRKGEEYIGIARWFLAAGDQERALALLQRSIQAGLPDALLFRAMWDAARLHKKCGQDREAMNLVLELAECPNAHRADALIELAKHYEHREPDLGRALRYAEQAAEISDSAEALHRLARLRRKAARPGKRRLL